MVKGFCMYEDGRYRRFDQGGRNRDPQEQHERSVWAVC